MADPLATITADEARALVAKWKGYDGPYDVSPDDEGDIVIHYEDMTVARVEDFDEHSEPLARLFAAAPDDVKVLAHTIEAQAEEMASLRAEVDEMHALVAAQSAILTGVANALRGLDLRAAKMKRELDEARAALMSDAVPCMNGRCEEKATRWVHDGWLERLRCDACSESMIAAGATYRDLEKAAAIRAAMRAETGGDRG